MATVSGVGPKAITPSHCYALHCSLHRTPGNSRGKIGRPEWNTPSSMSLRSVLRLCKRGRLRLCAVVLPKMKDTVVVSSRMSQERTAKIDKLSFRRQSVIHSGDASKEPTRCGNKTFGSPLYGGGQPATGRAGSCISLWPIRLLSPLIPQ